MNSLKHWLLISFCISFVSFAEVTNLQHGVNYEAPDNINDYYISEKLDGVRAYWDGVKLLTRQGNLIHAPQWFVAKWPSIPMDGELWSQRGEFQHIVSCVRRLAENQKSCWHQVTFNVFDLPADQGTFKTRYQKYVSLINRIGSATLKAVPQKQVSNLKQLRQLLEHVVDEGAEGLMLHHKNARYIKGRNANLMKYKQYLDAEATVLQHIPGKGKYTGKMGALLVKLPNGQQFKIGTGFTDHERKNPPPVGSIVTYRYIGKTDRGIPKFASFMRIRQTE